MIKSNVNCVLYCQSNSGHLQLIYTGFEMLARQNKINLTYKYGKSPINVFIEPSVDQLYVNYNGSHSMIFDTSDFGDISAEKLSQVDFYFKRSFSSEIIGSDYAYRKVFPLGLYYKVHGNPYNRNSLRRIFVQKPMKDALKTLIQEVFSPILTFHPKLFLLHDSHCYSKPNFSLEPNVIFMVNLWDPDDTKAKYKEERYIINQMRVECVQKLNKEFGSRFRGGFLPNNYSRKLYPDFLTSNPRDFLFGNYMNILKNYSIGVATTGLHKSIGWKFAEYIAFSKAIVSEILHYEAPGLVTGKHYSEFTTSDGCVEQVTRLMEDKPLRDQMMIDNHAYYCNYLSPDRLVWNALMIALEQQDASNLQKQ